MIQALTILTAIVCLLLMAVILIQNPKSGGIDASFLEQANRSLGAAKQTAFIEKITWTLSLTLLVLCLATAVVV